MFFKIPLLIKQNTKLNNSNNILNETLMTNILIFKLLINQYLNIILDANVQSNKTINSFGINKDINSYKKDMKY